MILFYPEGHAKHYQPGHPERPERVETIQSALRAEGWWDEFTQVEPAPVLEKVIKTVHTPAYLALLEMSCRRGGMLDADTYVTPASWQLAWNSAGGALAVAQAVWRKEDHSGFAFCRPPGHHARPGQAMGFCLLNNIAIAAENLIQNEGAKRLAIVDLDLHHGNGTQEIFYQRKDVFYMSIHQIPLFPGTGLWQETGAGEGMGFTANFPLPPRSGDRAFLTIMDELILPLLERYAPEMILVSYGFDPHWKDPLGSLQLSADGYARLIDRLVKLAEKKCGGRIAMILEGGYDLEAAAACTSAVTAALIGEAWNDLLGPAPYPESTTWEKSVALAKTIWL